MKNSNTIANNLRNNKGFTLIEMAIVLVIIGIIIGAVVKGQDLVDNAKSKQFASKIQAWQVALNTYYDRKGRYPGDGDRDGIIASADTVTPQADIDSANFSTPPESSFTIGGTSFKVKLGNDGSRHNYLAVCKDDTCSSAYDPADSSDLAALKYFEAFDTSIDSSANASTGTVKGFKTVTAAAGNVTALSVPGAADWMQAANGIKALGYQIK